MNLLRQWERFALPMVSAPSTGTEGRTEGTLLHIGGECFLSSIQSDGEEVRVRLWNPLQDEAASASVGGVDHLVPPASIVTIPLAKTRLP